MISEKGSETSQWGNDKYFQQVALRQLYIHSKRMKVGSLSQQYIKTNSKWIEDLNVRPKSLKLFQEKIGQKLHDIGSGNFLDRTPKAQVRNNRQTGLHKKLKIYFVPEENINRAQGHFTGENIFKSCI